MHSLEFALLALRARLAGAVFALVSSLSVLAAVFAVLVPAPVQLEPMLAKGAAAAAAAASAAVDKAPA
jgi:hypothetical protein